MDEDAGDFGGAGLEDQEIIAGFDAKVATRRIVKEIGVLKSRASGFDGVPMHATLIDERISADVVSLASAAHAASASGLEMVRRCERFPAARMNSYTSDQLATANLHVCEVLRLS